MLLRIRLGTAENRQNRISDVLVHGAAVGEDDGHQGAKILVEHFDDVVRFHVSREVGKAAHVGAKDSHLAALAAQSQASAMSQQVLDDLWRELPFQVAHGDRFAPQLLLHLMAGHGHGGILGNHQHETQVDLSKGRFLAGMVRAEHAEGFFLPDQRHIHAGFHLLPHDASAWCVFRTTLPDESFARG